MISLHPLVAQVRFFKVTPCFILRLMLPAETPRANRFAFPPRIMLWQHMGDLRPLGGISKGKWNDRVKEYTYERVADHWQGTE